MNEEKRRSELYILLGDLPPRNQPISAKKLAVKNKEYYIMEEWLLDLNGTDAVPAYFIKPFKGDGPYPAVLFNHSHGGNYVLGKDEVIKGNHYLQDPPYAEEFTRLGYAVLAIDAWGFGKRRGRSEGELFKEMLWNGQVLWGNMVYDSIRAVDYLVSRPDVDPTRIATMGISMGSYMSWWLSALDTRIKVCVEMCGLADFHSLIESRGLEGHEIYFYVPSLLKHFTTSEINALIAPRPHLSFAGNYDPLTPADGLDIIDAYLKKVYAEKNAPDAWKLVRYNIGHFETEAMRAEALNFLQKEL